MLFGVQKQVAEQRDPKVVDKDRRELVLESALVTFARFGYRKTSMDEVARTARISRPGLYFLFASKESLFRASVTHALTSDIAAVERILGDNRRPLHERLLASFDQWAGRYVGPMSREITSVIEDNPDLLGDIVQEAPRQFEALLIQGIGAELGPEVATRIAQTLISASIGLKHQVETREAYLQRLTIAINLLAR
jgi:AcrR family transcriptional regulator